MGFPASVEERDRKPAMKIREACPICGPDGDSSSSWSRREFLRLGLASAGAASLSLFGSIRYLLAEGEAEPGASARSVILLWLNGGPSHLDTFDPKEDTKTAGPFKPIETSVSGIRICEHLPQVARQMKHLALVRSMVSKEGNHDRARYLMHTGYAPQGTVRHPGFGSIVSCELGRPESELPNFVTIRGPSIGGGFLGARYSPFFIQDPTTSIANLGTARGIDPAQFDHRMKLLTQLEESFNRSRVRPEIESHREVYTKAARLVKSPSTKAFDLGQESQAVREAYGKNAFGQGVLMARRLVEAGVKFVEVFLDGWDTHQDNFKRTETLMKELDPAMATLLQDMEARGLLSSTLVLCMGEFGRTPAINGDQGRDHYPRAWSFAAGGGGIRGGQVIGQTSNDGGEVARDPVTPPDLFASLCHALGIDPNKQNYSSRGRPIKLVDKGKIIDKLFT